MIGKDTDIISVFLTLLRLAWWPNIWPILENVPCALQKHVCSGVDWNVLICLLVSFALVLFRSEQTYFAMKSRHIQCGDNEMLSFGENKKRLESCRLDFILEFIFWLRGSGQLLHFSRRILITKLLWHVSSFMGGGVMAINEEFCKSTKKTVLAWGLCTRRQKKQMFPFFSPPMRWSPLLPPTLAKPSKKPKR